MALFAVQRHAVNSVEMDSFDIYESKRKAVEAYDGLVRHFTEAYGNRDESRTLCVEMDESDIFRKSVWILPNGTQLSVRITDIDLSDD